MKDVKEFKVNNFDLLRLLAALEVIFDHYFQHLNIKLNAFEVNVLYLFPGVPVFFIISGYLISASFERNSDLKTYFKNRALRIFPGLWGCIILTIVVFSVTGVNFLNKQTLIWLPAQLVGLIYTPGFLSSYGFGSYNGSLWTIPLELQFYIVLPVIYKLLPKRQLTAWLLALLVIFWIANFGFQLSNLHGKIAKVAGYTFVPHIHLFLMGVIAQRLQLYKKVFIYNQALAWLAIYMAFCISGYTLLNPMLFEALRNFLLTFLILALAYTLPRTADRLLKRNDISYGVYMYHGLVLTVMVQEKYINSYTLMLLVIITMIMATSSWLLIERPFIKMKKRSIKPVPAN